MWSKSFEEGLEYYFALRTDISTNKPIVLAKKVIKGEESKIEEDSGFKVEAVLHAKLSPITRNNMKNKINEYISQTSIVNPYAIFEYETDEGKVRFERRTEVMPAARQRSSPSPSRHGSTDAQEGDNEFYESKDHPSGNLIDFISKDVKRKGKRDYC